MCRAGGESISGVASPGDDNGQGMGPCLGGAEAGEAAKEWRSQPAEGHTIDGEPEAWAAAAKGVDVDDNPDGKLGPLADRLLLSEGINASLWTVRAGGCCSRRLRRRCGRRLKRGSGTLRETIGRTPMADRFPSTVSSLPSPSTSAAKGGRVLSLKGLVEDWWGEAKAAGLKPSTRESYSNSMATLVAFLSTTMRAG